MGEIQDDPAQPQRQLRRKTLTDTEWMLLRILSASPQALSTVDLRQRSALDRLAVQTACKALKRFGLVESESRIVKRNVDRPGFRGIVRKQAMHTEMSFWSMTDAGRALVAEALTEETGPASQPDRTASRSSESSGWTVKRRGE